MKHPVRTSVNKPKSRNPLCACAVDIFLHTGYTRFEDFSVIYFLSAVGTEIQAPGGVRLPEVWGGGGCCFGDRRRWATPASEHQTAPTAFFDQPAGRLVLGCARLMSRESNLTRL